MISLDESIKRAWLEYAWEVVTDASHRVDCEKLGGKVFDLDATETRWPGYIGTNYSSGNPIFVSNIHRNFDSGGLTEDVSIVRDFSSANENWKSAGRSISGDNQFLVSTALNYERGLKSWNVGSVMRKYLRASGMHWSDVAYLNVAKCQSMDAGSKLQDLCIRRWPIERLVDALRPSVIVTCSIKIRDRGLKGTPVYWYHQLNKLDSRGRRQDTWMAELVANQKYAEGADNRDV